VFTFSSFSLVLHSCTPEIVQYRRLRRFSHTRPDVPDDLVDGVVPADVLAQHGELAVGAEAGGGVQAAGGVKDGPRTSEPLGQWTSAECPTVGPRPTAPHAISTWGVQPRRAGARPDDQAARRAARSCSDGCSGSTAGISTASPPSSNEMFDHTRSCAGGSAGPVATPSTP
jgi:hypothetical protein